MPQVNFSTIVADGTGSANPGGNRKVAVVSASAINGNWPTEALTATGEITAGPVLNNGVEWALYELPENTISWDSEQASDHGYHQFKHMIQYNVAKTTKSVNAELLKHMNAKSVYIIEGNDDQWHVVGSKQNPIVTKKTAKSGIRGSEQRGHVVKGESEGHKFDVCPLDAATATALIFGSGD
jgi:hypothetical protein